MGLGGVLPGGCGGQPACETNISENRMALTAYRALSAKQEGPGISHPTPQMGTNEEVMGTSQEECSAMPKSLISTTTDSKVARHLRRDNEKTIGAGHPY